MIAFSCSLVIGLGSGKLYATASSIAFYAKKSDTPFTLVIEYKDITHITKKSAAGIFPTTIKINVTAQEVKRLLY
jgi:ATP-dependent protease HslVU (ClpYQ) peptidase subunit